MPDVSSKSQPLLRLESLIKNDYELISKRIFSRLQNLIFKNKHTLHPQDIQKLSAEELSAFSSFLSDQDQDAVTAHGREMALVGLSESSISEIGKIFRKYFIKNIKWDHGLLEFSIHCVDEYFGYYLSGFVKQKESQTLRDQEELRRALSVALERQRRELSVKNHAIHTSINGVLLTDLDGYVTYVNPAFMEIWGYESSEELLGIHSSQFCGKTDFSEMREKVLRESGWQNEFTGLTDDGDIVEVFMAASIIRDEKDEPIGFMVSFTDITEQKQLEERLQKSQKLEAVGNLAGGVAHDFNNLLTVIIGFTDMLLLYLDNGDAKLLKYGEGIKESAEKASALTQQLLAFSRKQILQPMIIEIGTLIGDLSNMLKRVIREDISLEINNDTEKNLLVKADPVQIEQVLLNLTINARDAMPDGGTIQIDFNDTTVQKNKTFKYPEVNEGEYVLISVTDSGIGITDKNKEHIFEPFYTTKGPGKGTGLGLSTVYGIVRQSDGYIFVEDGREGGTRFKIYLPRVESDPEDLSIDSKNELPDRGNGNFETILVVEDEDDVRTMACESLNFYGYKTLEAASGQEALSKFKELMKSGIDLVITDIVMPNMNGYELIEKVKVLNPALKFLYMSGYTNDSIISKGIIDDNIPFLQKPFSPKILAEKVNEIITSE